MRSNSMDRIRLPRAILSTLNVVSAGSLFRDSGTLSNPITRQSFGTRFRSFFNASISAIEGDVTIEISEISIGVRRVAV